MTVKARPGRTDFIIAKSLYLAYTLLDQEEDVSLKHYTNGVLNHDGLKSNWLGTIIYYHTIDSYIGGSMKSRKQIDKEFRERGFITTDVRLEILKDLLESPNTDSKERWKILMFLMDYHLDRVDILDWLNELKTLTEGYVNEARIWYYIYPPNKRGTGKK